LFAQHKTKGSDKIYRIWVDTGKGSKSAYLATISDSVIYTSAKPVSFTDTSNTASCTPISYHVIKKIRVVKKGSPGKGFLTGLGIGLASGALIGLASGDDNGNCFICFTAGEKALIDGVFLGATGGITGAIIGLKEKKFKINGQRSKFDEMKQYMLRYGVHK